METLKILIPTKVPNWNDYIQMERSNKYIANNIKQKEKQLVKLVTKGKKYSGSYPIELVLKPHYSSFRQDLDNFRYKGILDGLVYAGVLKNDNLKHIQKIIIEPVFDDKECVDIEINELKMSEGEEEMTQREAILNYITEFGSITPMEAFADLGITKLATRISEMKKDGMEFKIDTVKSKNRYGKSVQFCKYSFKG